MRLGIILLVALAAWIAFTVSTGGLFYPEISLLGLGSGFEGSLALPKDKIDAALDAYRARVLSTADKASYFRFGSEVTSWLAFFATAAITLVAGWYGQTPPAVASNGGAPMVSGLPPKATRLVTMLAASAAVLTACGGLASRQGQTLNSWAHDRQHDFVQARNDIVIAKSAEDAQKVLDDLDFSIRQ